VACKFETYKDEAGEYRFRFKPPTARRCSARRDEQKKSAEDAIASIKPHAPSATINDQTKPA
jgi:uncharacterized protein